MIQTIPLNRLVPSPRNVRRAVDEEADLRLKADIEARGLLQNLVVTPVRKPGGKFAVEAGGRRLRTLQRLAEEKRIEPDHEVCCFVIEAGPAAREASLAENFQRLQMNPADECVAFRELIGEGLDVEAIARRFGLTTRFVEGRLRLADLAPVVFEALGSGEIGLDVAKAYAATPDRERQAWVFEQVHRSYCAQHADSIRRMMTQATASASDRRARFVGEEAYVAAGGRIERDLFAQDEKARWLDVALVERLAAEKLERLAVEIAAETGLGWVRPCLERWVGTAETEGLHRLVLAPPPLTEEDQKRIAALESEIDELIAGLESEEDQSGRVEAEERIRSLGAELEAVSSPLPEIDEALKPSAGAFLLLDELGQPRMDATFWTEAPLAGGGAAASPGSSSEEAAVSPHRAAGLSQRLVDELAMQRRDVLALHVAADPGFALDLAIFLMADREARSFEKSGSSLLALAPVDPVSGFRTPGAPAAIARAEAEGSLDRSWTEGASRAERLDAFRQLDEEARAAWLGHCVARTLEASVALPGDRACAFHDHLGCLLGIDVARWWRPTGANFFDRVPKSVALAALAEAGGPALSERYGKAKKAELAEACERVFAGDFIAEADVKQAALAWLPDAMRFDRSAGTAGAEGAAAGADERSVRNLDEIGEIASASSGASEEVEEAA